MYVRLPHRREFVDALLKNVKEPSETFAGQGIEYCNQLFKIKTDLESLKCKEQRKAKRLELEQPILDAFWSWIDDTLACNTILPKEKLAKAINYAQNHREDFMNYLMVVLKVLKQVLLYIVLLKR